MCEFARMYACMSKNIILLYILFDEYAIPA